MSDFLADYLLREHLPSDNFLFYNDCYYKGSRNAPFFDSKIVPLYEGLDVSHGFKLGYYKSASGSRASLYTRYSIPKEEFAHELDVVAPLEPNYDVQSDQNPQHLVKEEPMDSDSDQNLEDKYDTEKIADKDGTSSVFKQLEHGSNNSTSSWFERSVLQPYEPAMRRVVRRANFTDSSRFEGCQPLIKHQNTSDTQKIDTCGMDNGKTGAEKLNSMAGQENIPAEHDNSRVLVEHRWSHLFRKEVKESRTNEKRDLELLYPAKEFPFTNLYTSDSPQELHGPAKRQSVTKYIANIPRSHIPSVGIAPIDMKTLVLSAKVLRILLLQCEKGEMGNIGEIVKSWLNYEIEGINLFELNKTLTEYIQWFKSRHSAWEPFSHECIDYLFEFYKIDELVVQLKRVVPGTSSMLLYKVLLSVSSSLFMTKPTESLFFKNCSLQSYLWSCTLEQ